MQPDQDVIKRWGASAPYWEKHGEVIRQMFAPVTQALVEDAQIGSQHSVLDVAMGPGEPALSVGGLVGPEGMIFGIDPIPEMVAAARRAADRLGLNNAQFEVGFVDQLPLPADTFDAVISRFGVMFFPSPGGISVSSLHVRGASSGTKCGASTPAFGLIWLLRHGCHP